ncbi:MAG TPA: hypothetical protein VJL89_04965 [Thermodesulfovibrionia bacterium]|nr:hypothetical protein [Thermodesulfovibrionia bacterium]
MIKKKRLWTIRSEARFRGVAKGGAVRFEAEASVHVLKDGWVTIDIPANYLRWSLFLPEYYEYSRFEGPLKQVAAFSKQDPAASEFKSRIDIPAQGRSFLFEKYLIVDEKPYVRGKYGQYLGDDIFLSLTPGARVQNYQLDKDAAVPSHPLPGESQRLQQQVTPKF